MYDIYGTNWCNTCTIVKKELTARDIPFSFTTLPAGPRGWEIAEELSGRRALPVIMQNGVVVEFTEFKAAVSRHPARELTQHEQDELDE